MDGVSRYRSFSCGRTISPSMEKVGTPCQVPRKASGSDNAMLVS